MTGDPRALDKPADVQVAGADGGPIIIQWQRPEEPNTTTIKLDSNVVAIESHEPENE